MLLSFTDTNEIYFKLLLCSGGDPIGMHDQGEAGMISQPVDMMGRELQKWIQCCKCEKWRKVPYSIDEEQIPENWMCSDNVWDNVYNSCDVEQELSDDKIDAILQLQGEQELAYAQEQATLPPKPVEYAAAAFDDPYDDDYYDDSVKKGGRRGGRWGRGRGRGSRGRNSGGSRQRGGRRDEASRGKSYKMQGTRGSHDEAAQALLGIVGTEGEHGRSSERYYPGRLVWAKVEGHDWWPGKVVRRRAVPREVGLPPGGPAATRYQIPVVFFTAKGIPGEPSTPISDATAIDALKPISPESTSADDEAEYAWLVADALKPFKAGDMSGSADSPPTDEQLIECIEAANKAAEILEQTLQNKGEQYFESDSDGGWGPQTNQSVSLRGRRGGRGGRGRKGRGTKRGRGRGRWNRFDEEDVSDEDYEPGYSAAPAEYGSSAQKIVVESILGWRKKEGSNPESGDAGRSDEQKAMESAVDALLAAADGEEQGMEFLVKYIGRSHIHNEWVAESTLMQIAKRKVLNFKKRYGCDLEDSTPINLTDPSWSVPQRFISRRPAPHGPGWEILVKWSSLGIENATWESETDSFMTRPECIKLAKSLWERQAKALQRSSPNAQSDFANKFKEFKSNMTDITESPSYCDWPLMGHQIEGMNWLRRHWAMREHCIFADDQGLGKTATVLTFVRSLRVELLDPTPILIIAPSSSLGFWEGESIQWLGPDIDLVTYSGSAVARSTLLDNELWLNPSALDGRGVHSAIIKSKIPKADVVLTSHEAFSSDVGDLSAIQWDVVIFDERHRIQSASMKAHQSVGELEANHKILLAWPFFTDNVQELMAEVAFVKPEYQSLEDLPGNLDEEEDSSKQVAALQAELKPLTMQRPRSIIGEIDAPSCEIRIPVALRRKQIESYKTVLTKSYELLADPKASRFSGYRAVQLRSVVADLRAVCAHPQLESADISETPDIVINDESQLNATLYESEKLEAFDKLLQAEKNSGRRVAIFAHSASVLSLLSKCIQARFGDSSYVLINASTPSLDCRKAITSFNYDGSKVTFILMHPTSCGLGMSLDKLDSVVFFDSDWSVTSDIIALCRARKLGNASSLRVYRLFCENTIEQRLIDLAEKTRGMEVALRQSHGRAYSQGAKVLDDILRAGVNTMFDNEASPDPHGDVKQEEGGTKSDEPAEASQNVIHNDYFQNNKVDLLIKTDPEEALAAHRGAGGELSGPCLLNKEWQGAVVFDLTPLKPDPNAHQFTSSDFAEDDDLSEDGADPDAHSRAEAALLASKFWSTLLADSWQAYQKERGALQDASIDEEEDEEDEEIGRRISSSLGGAISYEEDDDPYRRRGRGRGRGRSRGSRRRTEDDDYESGYLRKRRRRPDAQHSALTPEALEYISEWNRQTAVMNAIADPSTAEALIARNAFDRLDHMGRELGLPQHIVDLSHQCAQILLVMRPSEEAPSDFQDYTLVAVIAVATYLGQYPMGEQHGVPTLARRYGQDSSALEQVFEYIIASVNNYRETYMRMQALQEEGALDDEEIDKISREKSHPTGGLMAAMSDLDGFAAKLNAILQADLRAAAIAAGPLQTPEIDLAANADPEHVDELKSLSEKLRSTHEQVDLLDRVQNIRVKNIQDEYQRFMERVRAKAQSAIDHANTTYSQQRNILMSRYESLSAEVKSRYPHLAEEAPIPQSIATQNAQKAANEVQGQDLAAGAGMNPMNMLSHSMASQVLALQSHYLANMAAQTGEGTLGQQQNLFGQMFSPADLEQYSQMIAKSAGQGPPDSFIQSMAQAAAAGIAQAATASMPAKPVSQDGRAASEKQATGMPNENAQPEQETARDADVGKSLMEMMEEDFEPEMGANLDDQEDDHALKAVPSSDANPVSQHNVTRVGSLSAWVPPTGGSNPSSPVALKGEGNNNTNTLPKQ